MEFVKKKCTGEKKKIWIFLNGYKFNVFVGIVVK